MKKFREYRLNNLEQKSKILILDYLKQTHKNLSFLTWTLWQFLFCSEKVYKEHFCRNRSFCSLLVNSKKILSQIIITFSEITNLSLQLVPFLMYLRIVNQIVGLKKLLLIINPHHTFTQKTTWDLKILLPHYNQDHHLIFSRLLPLIP